MHRHEQTINDLWRVSGRLLAPCVGGVLGQDHAWTNVCIASCQSGSKSSLELHTNTAPSNWGLDDTAISDTPGNLFAKTSSNHGKINTLINRIYQNSAAQRGRFAFRNQTELV